MSYFDDFLKLFKLDELKQKPVLSLVLGVGVIVVGKIKVDKFNEETVSILIDKRRIEIIGENLKIASVGSGEMIVSGDVKFVNMGV